MNRLPTSPSVETDAPKAMPQTVRVVVEKLRDGAMQSTDDVLAIEEPLEIALVYRQAGLKQRKSVSITMRTPGQDFELACGFLFSEGLIRRARDVAQVKHCGAPVGELRLQNVVRVELADDVTVDIERLQRHFYTTSSCGVCGKTSIEALHVAGVAPVGATDFSVAISVLRQLPAALRAAQDVFECTGGIHAAALFDTAGRLVAMREDVGRHNAVDKLIGAEILADRLNDLGERILLLSGRASFELIQKAAVAQIPIVAAIGAPSSLAVELARHYGLTLVGFLRDDRCNIYCGGERITNKPEA